jgi:hypothetical protein
MYKQELNAKAAYIFLRAAQYVKTYGWQVSGMGKYGKPRCSMGALASAYPKKVWESELSSLMYQQLYNQLNGIGLTEFNYKYQDPGKVVELFTKTAKTLLKDQS